MNTKMHEMDAALEKIKEYGAVKPAFKEEVLKAVLLLDLLRDVLGYDAEDSERQRPYTERQRPHEGSEGREIPDIILLKLAAPPGEESKNVFVEIKRYGAFRSKSKHLAALRQAAKYSITKRHDYGIVTDGVRWTYFVITDSTRPSRRKVKAKVARRVAEFDMEDARQIPLGKMILARSCGSELLALFGVLARVHKTMAAADLDAIKELTSIDKRIEAAWGEGKPSAKERKLLYLLYHKNNLSLNSEYFCEEILPLK